MELETMRARAALLSELRGFFSSRGYLEVDTPQLSPALIPESMIASFATRFESPFQGKEDLYLVPSPEVWMKRLLAAGSGDIFQISHCFRNAEQLGRIHNPEFTMLEWYTIGADYMDSADRTDELLEILTTPEAPPRLRPPCRRMSMAEAFKESANIDLLAAAADIDLLREEARRKDIDDAEMTEWEELFNAIFLKLVEPELPQDRPLILHDYPARIPTLAKREPGSPWCERWELYMNGIEVANCFTEETDPLRIEEYYSIEERSAQSTAAPPDESFREIFGDGFPASSGVALGVDRLLMSLLGSRDIRGVIFFPFIDIFDQPR